MWSNKCHRVHGVWTQYVGEGIIVMPGKGCLILKHIGPVKSKFKS